MLNPIGMKIVLEDKTGKRYDVVNQSADSYRLEQMQSAEWVRSGELCCRLGIPRIGSEWEELRIVSVG